MRLCRLSYDGKDYRLPNPRKDGALLELNDLDAVSDLLRHAHQANVQMKEALR